MRRHRSAVGVGDRDLTLPRLVQLRQHAGSHTTLPWREEDSNSQSHLNKKFSEGARSVPPASGDPPASLTPSGGRIRGAARLSRRRARRFCLVPPQVLDLARPTRGVSRGSFCHPSGARKGRRTPADDPACRHCCRARLGADRFSGA
jgi:hypothetical protein